MINRLDWLDGQTQATPHPERKFGSIKADSVKVLQDAVYNLGAIKRANRDFGDKEKVLQAISNCDYNQMREISLFFYRMSGQYSRLCRYLAYLFKMDWVLTPQTMSKTYPKGNKPEKIVEGFYKAITFLDNTEPKKMLGEIALKTVVNGSYYGYLIKTADRAIIQELPIKYCRSRYNVNNKPVVEFNMAYFKDTFNDDELRERMIKLFPPEFKKGWELYKKNKLPGDYRGDTRGWYVLDTKFAFKFNINGDDQPILLAVIPYLIDLDAAQDLDRKKMQQELAKIIVQKMPLDKNSELVFDTDEMRVLHNNAVTMLGHAINTDVLTTVADIDVVDMSDTTNASTADQLVKIERQVYNEAGISQMQFNTDGNIALEKSILNDEAMMSNLIAQFETLLNEMISHFNKNKLQFRVQILATTIYNYKEMAKLYKEQTQLGYSKMLPQIALGQSQSSILSNAYFENEVLDLVNVLVPPLMSSVMNADVLNRNKQTSSEGNGEVGRNEKADDQKSEKTIQNRESMN